jgi:hypothetical protein
VCRVERTGDESVSRRREKEKPSRRAFLQLRGGGVEGLVKSMTTRDEEEEAAQQEEIGAGVYLYTRTHTQHHRV